MTTATEAPAHTTSEHASRKSETAINVTNAQAVALVFEKLSTERLASIQPLAAPPKTVKLKKTVRVVGGGYAVVNAGTYGPFVPEFETVKSGKFTAQKKRGGALLDEVFAGGPAWATVTDDQLYTALTELAEATGATGRDLRKLNEVVQRLVLARSGFGDVPPWDLP
jgi:hypothetical protein